MSENPPVVCIVGRSKSGKTTFMEKLIFELKKLGYRVGTVKHHYGEFEIDYPGKDTWRHAQAGADVVFISSPRKAAMIKKTEKELSLKEMISFMKDVDIVLAEGYKGLSEPQIEVCLTALGDALVCRLDRLICLIGKPREKVKVPCFEPDSAKEVADLLVELFSLKGR